MFSQDDALKFQKRLTPIVSKYVAVDPKTNLQRKPTPKQALFMLLNVEEAGYGGATGGGKSDALLMDALQIAHIPGAASILFRRTFQDLSLPGNLMDRAHDWFKGTSARWRDREKTWEFPTEGKFPSTMTFGYMDAEKDRYRYKGSEVQYVGFDEGTQFSETQYTFMFSRMRYTASLKALFASYPELRQIPLRMRLATNPGDVGHEWVKRRFILEGKSNGIIWIPSGLKDNPHVDQESYMRFLMKLDPVTREQYINGNWDIVDGGGQFSRSWFDGRIKKNVPPMVSLVRAWDLAATKPTEMNKDPDWTVGLLLGVDEQGRFWVLDIKRIRDTAGEVAKLVRATADEDINNWGDDVIIWMEQEGGASGKSLAHLYRTEILAGYNCRFQKASGNKAFRARGMAQAAEWGNLWLKAGPWIPSFLDELELFTGENTENHDDQVDALSLGGSKLRGSLGQMSVGTVDAVKTTEATLKKELLLRGTSVKSANKDFGIVEVKEADDDMDPMDNPATQAALKRGRQFGWNGGL